jgi:hypothetical protein
MSVRLNLGAEESRSQLLISAHLPSKTAFWTLQLYVSEQINHRGELVLGVEVGNLDEVVDERGSVKRELKPSVDESRLQPPH